MSAQYYEINKCAARLVAVPVSAANRFHLKALATWLTLWAFCFSLGAQEPPADYKQDVRSLRLLRYFSPKGLLQQNTSDYAQMETGERLTIAPKPMGIFTGLLVPALPIPSAYRTTRQAIGAAERPDGQPMPMDTKEPPVVLVIDRSKGVVCYKSDCAKLRAICPPYILLSRPNPQWDCQFFKR